MSVARHHVEWLSLIDVSGPFLSLGVLQRVFPQGLPTLPAGCAPRLRSAYEEWQEGRRDPALHRAWVDLVLDEMLGLVADLVDGPCLPPGLRVTLTEHGEVLAPDFVLLNPAGVAPDGQPRLAIVIVPPGQQLDRVQTGSRFKASPASRMQALLLGANLRCGLVTNGEHWLLVHAPGGGATTSYIGFYAGLWLDEPLTLRAFVALLGTSAFFGAEDATPERLFADSAADQQEVTDQLGEQVRRAVEILVRAIDRVDAERGRELLAGFSEAHLYEAALTVMMRLVFLLAAEARHLLLHGNVIWEAHYAVTPLRAQLRELADRHGEAVLERRYNAWSRLLAAFRAVYGGVDHEDMRLPGHGGSLFDPDRFPFLEGRPRDSSWLTTPAQPLPIHDRTVLHLLDALQVLRVKVAGGGPAEARQLSFRALDVEQIGHIYEGLLDHTCVRATGTVLGLQASKGQEADLQLSELLARAASGHKALVDYLAEHTGRQARTLQKALDQKPEPAEREELRILCASDQVFEQVAPYLTLLRRDDAGEPAVVPAGGLHVAQGTDRRSTGTHYTPRGLAEEIVEKTLQPLVFEGQAEGWPRETWRRRSAAELLALKICDPAMGSGAFLVAACRYLARELVQAWADVEKAAGPDDFIVTPEGATSRGNPAERLLPADDEERLALALRYVAERCLYGVDRNPMAVEMAKLSLWLVTMQAHRPFTFVDHALRCGDSLVGVTSLEQIRQFDARPRAAGEMRQIPLFAKWIAPAVAEAEGHRRALEAIPAHTPEDVHDKQVLLKQAETATELVRALGDVVVGNAFGAGIGDEDVDAALKAEDATDRLKTMQELQSKARAAIGRGARPLHWPVEFPEVFAAGRFDGVVGNPPFMGGQKITGNLGVPYREWLVQGLGRGVRGSADLVAYFFLRAHGLVREGGCWGLLATNTIAQGDTREVGLDQILQQNGHIYDADPSAPWPGDANLEIARVNVSRGSWAGPPRLQGRVVERITPMLDDGATSGKPFQLLSNAGRAFIGSYVLGMGFTLTQEEAGSLRAKDEKNTKVLKPYVNGKDHNSHPLQQPSRWVIDFGDMTLSDASNWPDLMEIVRLKVKPEREALVGNDPTARQRRETWWRFTRPAPNLYRAISSLKRVIVCTRHSSTWCPAFHDTGLVFSEATVVFASEFYGFYACIQAFSHESWLRHFASSLRTDVRYTPSDCFETFPFPPAAALSALDPIGERYHEHRRQLMLARWIGLTDTYNLFHDPGCRDADIAELRRLHVEMDQAVAAAYGWSDLDLGHDFYDTAQGVRYTISAPARREVLRRLLVLNHERYAEEVQQGLHDKGKKGKAAKVPKGSKPTKAGGGASATTSPLADPTYGLPLFDQAEGRSGLPLLDVITFSPAVPAKPAVRSPVEVDGTDDGALPDDLSTPADGDDAGAIVAALARAGGPLGKAELLAAASVHPDRWNGVIAGLVATGRVIRTGLKRGARYELPGVRALIE